MRINAYTKCALILVALGLAAITGSSQTASAQVETPAAAVQTNTLAPRHCPPSVIYVTDFQLDPAAVESASGKSGGLLGGRREGPLRSRLAQHKDTEVPDSQELARSLSETIVQHLQSEGFRAQRLTGVRADYVAGQADGRLQFSSGDSSLPTNGWVITGWFEQVEEGKAAVEATVGFGAGSGKASADVAVSDLTGDPAQPFLVMGSGSRAKRMPGGLITRNPYVMAGKFVINKRQGADKEIKSLGKQIARSLVDYVKRSAKSQ